MSADPTARLLAVDAATLYFRAYHGLPRSLRSPDGTPINAVHGYLDMTAALLTRFQPGHYAACWDADWRPAFRVALVPSYKAHRVVGDAEDVPEDLAVQLPILSEALALFGLRRVAAPGFEADDVCATLAHRWPAAVDVVSGDRDLLQLVDDAAGVRVVYIGSGVAKAVVVTEAVLAERYGVPSGEAYLELAVLRGDPSDGLPGVPGIGAKTGAGLLAAHGGLDGLLAAAADPTTSLTPAKRRALLAGSEQLPAIRRVVRAVTDTPLDTDPTALALPAGPPPQEALDRFTERWGVRGPVARLAEVLAELGARSG